MMRLCLSISIAALLVTTGVASSADAPATQPAVSARGKVQIVGMPEFLKPDLSRVVIYVASHPSLDAMPHSGSRPAVAQRNKQFTPNFLVVRKDTVVEFPNWDKFDHNVFSRSKAAPAFDLDRYPYGQSKSREFDKLGVVQVFCNIHPSMRAINFVTPNDYFCRADSEGNFELRGLPPGHYELMAWQERCDEQRMPIDVVTGKVAEVSFRLEEN